MFFKLVRRNSRNIHVLKTKSIYISFAVTTETLEGEVFLHGQRFGNTKLGRHCCNHSRTKVASLHRTCQGRKAQGRRFWRNVTLWNRWSDRGTESRSEDDPPTAEVWVHVTAVSTKEGFFGMTFCIFCYYHLLPILTTPSYTSERFRMSGFFQKVVVDWNDANWILVALKWPGRSAGRDEKRHKGGRFSVRLSSEEVPGKSEITYKTCWLFSSVASVNFSSFAHSFARQKR